MSGDLGDALVRALMLHGGRVCTHKEYSGKLVETPVHHRWDRMTTAQAAYVNDVHHVFVHGFKDSDDVLVSFITSNRAAILRINGWMLCQCMVECGYVLDESFEEADVQYEREERT